MLLLSLFFNIFRNLDLAKKKKKTFSQKRDTIIIFIAISLPENTRIPTYRGWHFSFGLREKVTTYRCFSLCRWYSNCNSITPLPVRMTFCNSDGLQMYYKYIDNDTVGWGEGSAPHNVHHLYETYFRPTEFSFPPPHYVIIYM